MLGAAPGRKPRLGPATHSRRGGCWPAFRQGGTTARRERGTGDPERDPPDGQVQSVQRGSPLLPFRAAARSLGRYSLSTFCFVRRALHHAARAIVTAATRVPGRDHHRRSVDHSTADAVSASLSSCVFGTRVQARLDRAGGAHFLPSSPKRVSAYSPDRVLSIRRRPLPPTRRGALILRCCKACLLHRVQ